MWSTPVTLGGGMTMEKAGLPSSMRALKVSSASQRAYQRCSTSANS